MQRESERERKKEPVRAFIITLDSFVSDRQTDRRVNIKLLTLHAFSARDPLPLFFCHQPPTKFVDTTQETKRNTKFEEREKEKVALPKQLWRCYNNIF